MKSIKLKGEKSGRTAKKRKERRKLKGNSAKKVPIHAKLGKNEPKRIGILLNNDIS